MERFYFISDYPLIVGNQKLYNSFESCSLIFPLKLSAITIEKFIIAEYINQQSANDVIDSLIVRS